TGGVADRIVRPGRELVLAAVRAPRVARARLGDLEAELRVRHHVDPWSRGPLPLTEDRDVLATARRESPQAVPELQIQSRRGDGFVFLPREQARRSRLRFRALEPDARLRRR